MSQERRRLGALSEEIAARFLRSRGYRIAERNVRLRQGEIDIVAWDGNVLVFVEVRSRKGDRLAETLESVNWRKRRRLASLAQAYLQRYRLDGVTCRFDVVAVTWDASGTPRVQHLPAAFELA